MPASDWEESFSLSSLPKRFRPAVTDQPSIKLPLVNSTCRPSGVVRPERQLRRYGQIAGGQVLSLLCDTGPELPAMRSTRAAGTRRLAHAPHSWDAFLGAGFYSVPHDQGGNRIVCPSRCAGVDHSWRAIQADDEAAGKWVCIRVVQLGV